MKANRPDYDESPFFFEETYQDGQRLVAWAAREEHQQLLFFTLLDGLRDRIEYLFKERDYSVGVDPKTDSREENGSEFKAESRSVT
jgi:hypothetical protein